jgi:hypothetical protein
MEPEYIEEYAPALLWLDGLVMEEANSSVTVTTYGTYMGARPVVGDPDGQPGIARAA